ncbi:MAG: PrsW family intramembrane metalloprotease [Propionibacteriaceae bacterium]|jgi:RsiW-degrading membrane proteinase PrsW (M82 family)|nr:PrsW family intramembrane metalloprotease [Propionibacteriaceae bacterium]
MTLIDRAERRQRAIAGLPLPKTPGVSEFSRVTHSRWAGVALTLFLVYGIALALFYFDMRESLTTQIREVTQEMGQPNELTNSQYFEAFFGCAKYAAYTALAWGALFFLIDRLRPTFISMKLLAFGWGASVSVLISLELNTWMGTLVNVQGPGDAGTADRTAIFVAPFVEEMSKASIVFLLAMAMRYKLATAMQLIPLAGLSAIGFAFSENILYYARGMLYATKLYGVDPESLLHEYVMLRGVYTSFGHPLFTCMLGIGLYMGVRQANKVARVLWPLAGFMLGVTGHMMFNGLATAGIETKQLSMIGIMCVLMIGMWVFRQFVNERAAIGWRLDDYVRAGWLNERDPLVFMSMLRRGKLLLASFLRGWKVWRATANFINDIVELAYLRQYMTKGLIDQAGVAREHELIVDIAARRPIALSEVEGLKIKPENWTVANAKARVLRALPWRHGASDAKLAAKTAPVGYRQGQYSPNLVGNLVGVGSHGPATPPAAAYQAQQGRQISTWAPPTPPVSRQR